MESNGADSSHLPHGQASKWWSYRDTPERKEFGSITGTSCHHLPSLTASSKLYPSPSTPSAIPSNTVGGTGDGKLICKGEPSHSLGGLCLHHPSACSLLKLQFSENGGYRGWLGIRPPARGGGAVYTLSMAKMIGFVASCSKQPQGSFPRMFSQDEPQMHLVSISAALNPSCCLKPDVTSPVVCLYTQ